MLIQTCINCICTFENILFQVKDIPGAKELVVKGGGVEIENVSFEYEPGCVIMSVICLYFFFSASSYIYCPVYF